MASARRSERPLIERLATLGIRVTFDDKGAALQVRTRKRLAEGPGRGHRRWRERGRVEFEVYFDSDARLVPDNRCYLLALIERKRTCRSVPQGVEELRFVSVPRRLGRRYCEAPGQIGCQRLDDLIDRRLLGRERRSDACGQSQSRGKQRTGKSAL